MDNTQNAAPAVPATGTTVPTKPAADASKPQVGADGKPIADPKGLTKAEAEVIRKIKVGDNEYDETTLASMIEKSKGADKKFLEAAKARKEAMRFFKMAKDNPREFLAKTGLDPKKFAYDEVAKDIQNKLRDPKEVELEQAQQRLKEYEAKEAAEKAQRAEEKLNKEAQALEQRFHAEMIEALETYPEIPKNGFAVAQLARAIDTIREKHGVLLTAKEVAPQVIADIKNMVKGVISKATPEQLEAMLGEDTMKALRAYDVAKLKNPLKDGSGTVVEGDKPKPPKWKNARDFWKSIDRDAKAERGE